MSLPCFRAGRRSLLYLLLPLIGASSCHRQPRVPPPGISREASELWRRALAISATNPNPAIIVSRVQFADLPPIQSWEDTGALRTYIAWADRWETAVWKDGVLSADLGSYDLILIRYPAAGLETSSPMKPDPVGFAVFDPGPGEVKIGVRKKPGNWPIPTRQDLPFGTPPSIEIAEFAGQGIAVLYGAFPGDAHLSVHSSSGAGEILYRSATQVNAKLPSIDRVEVRTDQFRSGWREVLR